MAKFSMDRVLPRPAGPPARSGIKTTAAKGSSRANRATFAAVDRHARWPSFGVEMICIGRASVLAAVSCVECSRPRVDDSRPTIVGGAACAAPKRAEQETAIPTGWTREDLCHQNATFSVQTAATAPHQKGSASLPDRVLRGAATWHAPEPCDGSSVSVHEGIQVRHRHRYAGRGRFLSIVCRAW